MADFGSISSYTPAPTIAQNLESMVQPEPKLDHTFSPAYDLISELQHEGKTYTYRVHKGALVVASRVWRRTLDPENGFAPLEQIEVDISKTNRTAVHPSLKTIPIVRIEDVTPDSLEILFNILHHRPKKVPKTTSFVNLRSIAILADRYELKDALEPSVEMWVSDLMDPDNDHDPVANGCEDWLFIAKTFPQVAGCRDVFPTVIAKFIYRSWLAEPVDGIWTFQNFSQDGLDVEVSQVDTTFIPQVFIDYILKTREQTLDIFFPSLHHFVQSILSPKALHSEPESSCTNVNCVNIATGSLLRSLYANNLHFLLQKTLVYPKEYSITGLGKFTEAISFQTMNHYHDRRRTRMAPGPKSWFISSTDPYEDTSYRCPLMTKYDDIHARWEMEGTKITEQIKGCAELLLGPLVEASASQ